MTAPARISQADIDRATKSVKAAGYTRARIVMDLNAARIEIIIGEAPNAAAQSVPGDWADEDV